MNSKQDNANVIKKESESSLFLCDIRRLDKEDLAELIKLDTECNPLPWSGEIYLKEMGKESAAIFGAFKDKLLIGFLVINTILEEAFIVNLGVTSSYRKLGIAKNLIEHYINCVNKDLIKSISLEVRENNTPAINLYKNFGFSELGRRPKYYSDTLEDAIILTKYF